MIICMQAWSLTCEHGVGATFPEHVSQVVERLGFSSMALGPRIAQVNLDRPGWVGWTVASYETWLSAHATLVLCNEYLYYMVVDDGYFHYVVSLTPDTSVQ